MSVIKCEVTEEHLTLLKHLRWSINDKKLIVNVDEDDERETPVPYISDTLYEGLYNIIFGKPKDFDPLKAEEPKEFTNEEKEKMDKVYGELPLVLEVILYTGKVEAGTYIAQYHTRDWRKKNI